MHSFSIIANALIFGLSKELDPRPGYWACQHDSMNHEFKLITAFLGLNALVIAIALKVFAIAG